MAFASIRPALKYTALLRTYNGQSSSGGVALYDAPVMIKCYPSVENALSVGGVSVAISNKTVLYVSGDIPIKEQDLIIFENASPNWLGKEFMCISKRNEYYADNPNRLIANKTWCCVGKKAQYWDGTDWVMAFDGVKIDGETTEGFQGATNAVKSVSRYFDGFGWGNDAENDDGLSLQEITL